jgi:hypothetical protein
VTVNVIEFAVANIGANGTLEEWHGELEYDGGLQIYATQDGKQYEQ